MIYYNDNGEKILMADVSEQSDWNQTDETSKDFIKNKPSIENLQNELNSKAALDHTHGGTLQSYSLNGTTLTINLV